MVMASFVPQRDIRELRDLTRRRTELVRAAGWESQRLEKELEGTGMKLSAVLSDITGASGRAILEALIAGERDPGRLADLTRGRARNKIPALIEALDGEFTDHHAFMVRHYLDEIVRWKSSSPPSMPGSRNCWPTASQTSPTWPPSPGSAALAPRSSSPRPEARWPSSPPLTTWPPPGSGFARDRTSRPE
jgi:hypothetical protein